MCRGGGGGGGDGGGIIEVFAHRHRDPNIIEVYGSS